MAKLALKITNIPHCTPEESLCPQSISCPIAKAGKQIQTESANCKVELWTRCRQSMDVEGLGFVKWRFFFFFWGEVAGLENWRQVCWEGCLYNWKRSFRSGRGRGVGGWWGASQPDQSICREAALQSRPCLQGLPWLLECEGWGRGWWAARQYVRADSSVSRCYSFIASCVLWRE